MDQFRFRPRVVGLEDRLTPATPAQIFNDLATVRADAEFMTQFNQHPEYMTIGVYQPFVAGMLNFITKREQAAAADLAEFQTALVAQIAANPASAAALTPALQQVGFAQFQATTTATVAKNDLVYLSTALGFKPATTPVPPSPPTPVPPSPPTPSPPTPSPPTPVPVNDSGMSNTIPNINSPEFQTAADGLKTMDVVVGTGTPVKATDSVNVYYTGWLTDGTVFDQVRSPSLPANFSLSGVVPGFAQGVLGMQPGGIRNIVIPPDLGYGNNPPPGSKIPAGATLVFQVKLISTGAPITSTS